MRIGIVGAGMLGLSLGYYLARAGHQVTVFEGKPTAGGLLETIDVDGARIDKYYHCILNGDIDLLELVAELGLTDRVRFAPARQGVYRDGKLYPMASGKDLLCFPPLTFAERIRLGLTVLGAFRIDDWSALEEIGVEDWLVGLGGRGAFEKVWKPLLKAKFDANYDRTPATYIWSRIKRTSSAKAAAGRGGQLGYFVGSYRVLVDRLVAEIERAGSEVRVNTAVDGLVVDDGSVTGVQVGTGFVPLDALVATTPLPILERLIPEQYRARLALPPATEFLGVICGLLLLDRPLSPYFTLNIAQEGIPFTGVIETTNVIAPEHVGGHHLVYVPKYVTRTSPYHALDDDDLRDQYVEHLSRMLPAFRESTVRHAFVFRERFVEPLHQIGRPRPAVPMQTAVDGLYIVNNGQIYPELTNCQASVRHARLALGAIATGGTRVSEQAARLHR